MSTGAERQRRLRARRKMHAEGDHSLCIPGKCDALADPVDLDVDGLNEAAGDAGGDVTGDVTPPPKNPASRPARPADLGARGGRLWDEMAGLKLSPTHVLLLERACRKADRLERMDAQLKGREWLELIDVPNTDGGVVRVIVDRVLSEIRQTEVALKLDVAELRHAGRPATAAGATPPTADDKPEGGGEGGKFRGLAAIRGGLDNAAGS